MKKLPPELQELHDRFIQYREDWEDTHTELLRTSDWRWFRQIRLLRKLHRLTSEYMKWLLDRMEARGEI
jgi:hypothetical protein